MSQIRERRDSAVAAYVASVAVSACVLLVAVDLAWGSPRAAQALFFWVLYAFGDRLSIEEKVHGIPQAGLKPRLPLVSAGFMVLMAAAFATNPATVAVVGLATPLIPGPWRGWVRSLFNAAQCAVYGGAASAAFLLLQRAIGRTPAALILAAFVGTVVAVVLNTTLVAGVMALERRRRLLGLLREMAWTAVANLPFSLVALLIAILYKQAGPAAAIFILAPLWTLRSAWQGKADLDHAQERTLRAFVRAVELKDPYTSRHSERVAAIAVELHRALGSSDAAIQRRYYGALLHDIGKVAVSGRILTKEASLSDEEYEVVTRHPGIGGWVVGGVSFLSDLVPEVLYHHERIDGRGYPSKLRGDQIPREARVLAVADTFEALTSDRPYRPGLSNEEAILELRRSSGTQLDPEAVEALCQLVRDEHIFGVLPLRIPEFRRTDTPLALDA